MNPLRVLRTWRLFRRVVGRGPELFTHRHDPARIRAAQRAAARDAFLSQLPTGQRQLAGPHFGDTE
ncbi:hypothetical protein [Phenylobacterium ferrooxidans]|uniref:Uncharacterized protein n=1 Tax=Phenylobacterium ferrooxidans TaxID=2982689 RepID=A0ABW6CNP3_9CAUL